MKEIPVTGGHVALVDDDEFDRLSKNRWHLNGRYRGETLYAIRWSPYVDGKRHKILMHHEVIGRPPKGFVADHKDLNRLNNQRSNLRHVSRSQSNINRRAWGDTSRFRGVSKQGRKWQAAIHLDGKAFYLGLFTTQEEAALSYDAKARELFGEFARPNFPTGA